MQHVTVPRATWDAMVEALDFYASREHFVWYDATAWDTVSGEPQNFWEDESNTAMVEDGSIAKQALTAANAVSHANPETAPVTEGGAITSESAVAFYEQSFGVKLTDSAQIGGVLRLCNLAANAVRPLADISEVPRTEHEYSIKLGTLQPQAQGEAKTYAPSRQRVVMACDILDRIKEAHENWGGWSGTPSSCDAAINLLRYPANMPVNAAQPQATEPADQDSLMEKAYERGWIECACWANRDDLRADVGSPAYLADRSPHLDAVKNGWPLGCEKCIDPDGIPCFPQYGVGPHTCFYKIPGAKVGESQPLPKDQWPDNYREDPDCPGMGVYWCPHCGSGKPAPETKQ